MSQLDVYYRALLEYREKTTSDKSCTRFCNAFSRAGADRVEVTKAECTVEEDWIQAIEEGLVYVEKAIKQERQFIYSNGEVLPIEKVKHISRESVEHLAKHSDLITREQTGEDIIPDKLYSVERLNNYAIYENRFLYMLLCYLRDFVTLRYNKILEFTCRYEGQLSIDKEITFEKRKIKYKVDLSEESRDDKYLREHNSAKAAIDRIDLILKTVLAFLATPLMECAGKEPMLKPPITKTNILKMDNDFKGAVRLYEYIIAYDKDGYSVDRTVQKPMISDSVAEEFSEAGILLSFLTYEYGLGIQKDLAREYELSEAKRKQEEAAKKAEQIEALKKKLERTGKTLEEYVLELEKYNRMLQSQNSRIEPLVREVASLEEQRDALKNTVAELEKQSQQLKEEIIRREQEYFRIIEETKSTYERQISDIKAMYDQQIRQIIENHEQQIAQIREQHTQELTELNNQLSLKDQAYKIEIEGLNAEIADQTCQKEEALAEIDKLSEEKELLNARIKALRAENGSISAENFTDKDSFDELEREFEAFSRFYKNEWKKTKKEIRKTSLKWENFKGQKEQE